MKRSLRPWLTGILILLIGFAAGAFVGRRWRGDFADVVLTFLTLLTSATLLLLALYLVFKRARRFLPKRREPASSSSRLSFGFLNGKGYLTLKDFGPFESFQLSLTLPGSWMSDSGAPVFSLLPVRTSDQLALILFILSLAVYAITRLVALDQFPIYFFADEAIEGVLAAQLIQRGLRDYQNQFLPVFFNTYGFFNPLISVYFQLVGILLLGKSIVVTRGAAAVVTLIGSAAASLILKFGLQSRTWWAGILFLAAMPAWFLHSRTAFETAAAVSLYACFLLLYVLYRYRSPNFIYPALVFAAATFYSYGNGQLVIGVTALLLLFSDLRYHFQNRLRLFAALGLLVLLALPYYRFQVDHPTEITYHLRTLDSYLFRAIPLESKIREFASAYAYGLSPQYWFLPNSQDLARHRLKDYGNVALWVLPFFLIGLAVCIRGWRSSARRLVLIALFVAPIGGALTQVAITRVLTFIVPASILATMGLEALLARWRQPYFQKLAPIAVFVGLSFASFSMLGDALANGPLWFRDYGLYGMQWGAKQLFTLIPTMLEQSPETVVFVSPTWANGTEVFAQYFMPNEPRLRFGNVDAWMAKKQPLERHMLFVMTPEELGNARKSDKFRDIQVDKSLAYPDGSDGFYFVRMSYADNIDQIFAAELAERLEPVTEKIQLNGESVTVSHTRFESGALPNLFDGDTFTLVRTIDSNPAFLEFVFPTPRHFTGISADFGSMELALTLQLFPSNDAPSITLTNPYRNLPPDPHVEMSYENAPLQISKLRLEVKALGVGDGFKIHIRELKVK